MATILGYVCIKTKERHRDSYKLGLSPLRGVKQDKDKGKEEDEKNKMKGRSQQVVQRTKVKCQNR